MTEFALANKDIKKDVIYDEKYYDELGEKLMEESKARLKKLWEERKNEQ